MFIANPEGWRFSCLTSLRETFVSLTTHGGHDGEERGIRYIEWTFDADLSDTVYTVDFAYLLREANRPLRVVHDHHVFGIFSREVWLSLLADAGFEPKIATRSVGARSVCRSQTVAAVYDRREYFKIAGGRMTTATVLFSRFSPTYRGASRCG